MSRCQLFGGDSSCSLSFKCGGLTCLDLFLFSELYKKIIMMTTNNLVLVKNQKMETSFYFLKYMWTFAAEKNSL